MVIPVYVTLLGTVRYVPAPNRLANTVEKYSGSAALPKSFRRLLCLPHRSTIPYMSIPTRLYIFEITRKGLCGVCLYDNKLGGAEGRGEGAPMGQKKELDTEDKRKLHAEINQIMNQRFLLTTAAITVFGAFSAFMIPKAPSHPGPVVGHLLLGGTGFLLLFLLLLFLWNRFLSVMQTTPAWYLIHKEASRWEGDFRAFRSANPLSIGKIQTYVFLALGVLSTGWSFVVALALGITLDPGWVLAVVCIAVCYFFLVNGFGLRRWFRDDIKISAKWQAILTAAEPEGRDPSTGTNAPNQAPQRTGPPSASPE